MNIRIEKFSPAIVLVAFCDRKENIYCELQQEGIILPLLFLRYESGIFVGNAA